MINILRYIYVKRRVFINNDMSGKVTIITGGGKGIGFGFGLWILGPIFEAILAFSRKSKYIGFNRK